MDIYGALTMRISDAIIRITDFFYIAPFDRLIPRHTFRYGLCGAATYFIFDPALYAFTYHAVLCKRIVHVGAMAVSPEIAALAIVFPITFTVGFLLNRCVVFRSSQLPAATQLVRHAAAAAAAFALNYVLMRFFVRTCGFWPTPSKVLVSAICTVCSYLAAEKFSFRTEDGR